MNKLYNISQNNKIFLCRLPSHTGIGRNNKAYIAAKSALDIDHEELKILHKDFKQEIDEYLIKMATKMEEKDAK